LKLFFLLKSFAISIGVTGQNCVKLQSLILMEEFDIDIVQQGNMAMLMALQGHTKEWVMFKTMMTFQMK